MTVRAADQEVTPKLLFLSFAVDNPMSYFLCNQPDPRTSHLYLHLFQTGLHSVVDTLYKTNFGVLGDALSCLVRDAHKVSREELGWL